jgi:dUTP pyrophosphatase
MISIKFKKLTEDAQLPFKATEDDACFDVVAVSREITDKYVEYGLGFSTGIPPRWEGVIRPRSSVSKYDLIMCNSPATIDAGYRGEWKVRFKMIKPNFNGDYKIYEVGDKIAQITFQRVPEIEFKTVKELKGSERGVGAFGSTGE